MHKKKMKYNYLKLQSFVAAFNYASGDLAHTDGIKDLCTCASERIHITQSLNLCCSNLVPLPGFLKRITAALKCKIHKVINMALQLHQKIDHPIKHLAAAALVYSQVCKLISWVESAFLPMSIERPSPRGQRWQRGTANGGNLWKRGCSSGSSLEAEGSEG